MKALIPYIIIVLLVCVYIIDDDLERKESLKSQHDNQQERDSLQSKLKSSESQRDSLRLRLDSLIRIDSTTQVDIDKTDDKIREIHGRYSPVPNDSLSKLMDKRADDARQTH